MDFKNQGIIQKRLMICNSLKMMRNSNLQNKLKKEKEILTKVIDLLQVSIMQILQALKIHQKNSH